MGSAFGFGSWRAGFELLNQQLTPPAKEKEVSSSIWSINEPSASQFVAQLFFFAFVTVAYISFLVDGGV
jgi:hypothetical protein